MLRYTPEPPTLLFVFTIVLWSLNPVCNSLALNPSSILLVKTKETFKLADLQLLAIQQKHLLSSRYDCQRLVLDRATGSSLLQLIPPCQTTSFDKDDDDDTTMSFTAWWLEELCDWVGKVLVDAATPSELITKLSEISTTSEAIGSPWTLQYVRFCSFSSTGPTASSRNASSMGVGAIPRNQHYTQSTLVCAVAQTLDAPAALDPVTATSTLIIVDTLDHFYLVQQQRLTTATSDPAGTRGGGHNFAGYRRRPLTKQTWAQRPFPYSSATNYEVASIILDLLHDRVLQKQRTVSSYSTRQRQQQQHQEHRQESRALRFLDATCGSGTFLALALDRGMHVIGIDSNVLCYEGSQRNLEFIFDSTRLESSCLLLAKSCLDLHRDELAPIDCVACNLPWGVNSNFVRSTATMLDHEMEPGNDNDLQMLLRGIRQLLDRNIPCAFIFKDRDDHDDCVTWEDWWHNVGYHLIGQAHIPQKNFSLPTGRGLPQRSNPENMQSSMKTSENRRTGRSDCLVCLVETQ